MKRNKATAWDPKLMDPSLTRQAKPRSEGLTMVLDKGLGMSAFLDLLEMASDYIDWIKLGFGTAGLTPAPLSDPENRAGANLRSVPLPGRHLF